MQDDFKKEGTTAITVRTTGPDAPDTARKQQESAHSGEISVPDLTTPGRAAAVSSVYPNLNEPRTVMNPAVPVASAAQSAAAAPSITAPADDTPLPVVKVLSVRGVEYAMMSILLWIGAGSLIFLLVSLINGSANFDAMAFPLSLLLVCVPGFAFFYLRLRKAELANPALRLDASKRRFSQITQIVAFLTCFFNIVTVVYLLLGMAGGNETEGIAKVLGSTAVTLAIAGGILAYYWYDEHKLVERR